MTNNSFQPATSDEDSAKAVGGLGSARPVEPSSTRRPLAAFADDPGRVAGDYRVGGDVLGYNRAGADNGKIANRNAGKNDCAGPYPGAVSDANRGIDVAALIYGCECCRVQAAVEDYASRRQDDVIPDRDSRPSQNEDLMVDRAPSPNSDVGRIYHRKVPENFDGMAKNPPSLDPQQQALNSVYEHWHPQRGHRPKSTGKHDVASSRARLRKDDRCLKGVRAPPSCKGRAPTFRVRQYFGTVLQVLGCDLPASEQHSHWECCLPAR